MTKYNIICSKCKKRIILEADDSERPCFCPFCACAVSYERINNSVNSDYTDENVNMKNVTFVTADGQPCALGRIPGNYSPTGRIEPYMENADSPLLIWAAASGPSGRRLFCRPLKCFYYPKAAITEENRFLDLQEYLDSNAVSLLGTNNIQLIKKFQLPEKDQQILRAEIDKDIENVEAQCRGDLNQTVIQSVYGGGGAKLYCTKTNGKTRYLLLNAVIHGIEYGSYSPMSRQLLQRSIASQQRVQMMGFNPPTNPYQNQINNAFLPVDTNPKTPFGMHRTDGLDNAYLAWNITSFAGFLTDKKPTEKEISDFFEFVYSIKLHRNVTEKIEQIQKRFLAQKMEEENIAFNAVQQMAKDNQRSWDRQRDTIQSLNETRDRISAEMRESANADFEHRSRLQHESMMGVNTFGTTDGSTVEHSINYDRVFQSDSQPDITVGVSGYYGEAPLDWTELEKLK